MVEAANAPAFFEIASREAQGLGLDLSEYLAGIEKRARAYIFSDQVVDRGGFARSIKDAMHRQDALTLVLGGKSQGKSIVRKHVVKELRAEAESKLMILDVDMRSGGKPLFEELACQARRRRQFGGARSWAGDALGCAGGLCTSRWCPTSASRVAQSVDGSSVGRLREQQGILRRLIAENKRAGRQTAIVIDEADLAVPHSTDEAVSRQMLQWIVGITKQDKLASVVLFSSDYSYPYLLRKAGLSLSDINTVILACDVPEQDMRYLLTATWGMGQELACEFLRFFGGHVQQCCWAAVQLRESPAEFDPFTLLPVLELHLCIDQRGGGGDAGGRACGRRARRHLHNLARRGFSHVSCVELDAGAQLIVRENIAGLIARGRDTGLPHGIWDGTSCQFALVADCRLMQLKILRALAMRSVGFKIFVKMLTGETIAIDNVNADDTIQSVKARIPDTGHIPSDQLILTFAGKRLEVYQTLESYNIQEELELEVQRCS